MIFRVKKDNENPYVMMNKTFLNDERLTAKGKGILSYLLSLPDDWQIHEEEITKHFADGVKSIRAGIKELIKLEYITRKQHRKEKGQFSSYEYCVYEVPTVMPFREGGKWECRKRHTTNNDLTNNNYINNKTYISIADAYSFSSTSRIFYNRYVEIFDKQPRMTHKTSMDNPMFDGMDEDDIISVLDDLFEMNEDARTLEYLESIIDRYR